MTSSETRLDVGEASLVLNAIRETCTYRHWTLLAAHVRSTHTHLVVDGILEASDAIRDFKAYASRALKGNEQRRFWARGGNVTMLRDSGAVRAAVRYVIDCQGPEMARYLAPDL